MITQWIGKNDTRMISNTHNIEMVTKYRKIDGEPWRLASSVYYLYADGDPLYIAESSFFDELGLSDKETKQYAESPREYLFSCWVCDDGNARTTFRTIPDIDLLPDAQGRDYTQDALNAFWDKHNQGE